MVFVQILIALAAFAGQLIDSGICKGKYRRDMYAYYTNLSNVLVFLYFLGLVLVPHHTGMYHFLAADGTIFAVMMSIMLTFTVFHFILAPAFERKAIAEGRKRRSFDLGNFFVHYLVPLLTFGYWCIFGAKDQLDYVAGLTWLWIPIAYLVYTWIRVKIGRNIAGTDSPYPYFFLDPDKVGKRQAVRNVAVLAGACLAAGVLMISLIKN